MPSPKILLALAAIGASVVSGVFSHPAVHVIDPQPLTPMDVAEDDCKSVTVKSASDANIDCKTVRGDIIFDEDSDIEGHVDISGPEKVNGNIVVKKSGINSLGSSSIEKIGGKFQLQQLNQLATIDFTALEEVNEIEWISLTALESVKFGKDGVTTVDKVRISDTSLSSLEGLNMASVGTFAIDNNHELTMWETRLTEITKNLVVADNSADLEVSFPRLTNAADIDVRGVKSLKMPLLEEISGSFLLTDNNVMESFIAPNLTETGESVSLRNNDGLSNVSFPLLEKTGGSLTLHNNQKLVHIDGFPKLEKVKGSVTMRGNFTE